MTRVAGVPYESFVNDELFAPLNAELAFRYAPHRRVDAATGYMPRWSPIRLALWFLVPSWIYGSATGRYVALQEFALDTAAIGGIVGAAEAFVPMLREMLSTEDGVLTAKSKREMLSLHSRGAAGIMSRAGVGLGWKRGEVDGAGFWNHEGGGAGFCSETRIYPQADLGIVVLMNLSQSVSLSKVCHGICERLRRDATG